MAAVDELIAALDSGTFDKVLDGLLDSLDKAGLTGLMGEMNSKVDSIPDQAKRHLFKNGISSIKMTTDTM